MKKILIIASIVVVIIIGIVTYRLFFSEEEPVIKDVPYSVSELDYVGTFLDVVKMPNGKLARCNYDKETNTIKALYLDDGEAVYYNDDGTLKDNDDGFIINGLDEILEVPDERKTKKGFQKFVCDWIGSIDFIVYDNKLKYYRENQCYGGSYIDYLSKGWDLNRNKSYGCNSIDYVLMVLRNSFGQCADSFLGVETIMNEFSEIPIENVQIGDTGVAYIEDGNIPGICVGFDNGKNPIFTLISSVPKNYTTPCMTKEVYNDYKNNKNKYSYCFVNCIISDLLKQRNRDITNCGLKDRFFYKFYSSHSAIPWLDPETDGTSNNKDLIIDDIEKYNDQENYRELLAKGEWMGDDLGARWQKEHERVQNILKKEREDRINKIFSIPDVKIVEIYPEESDG